MAKKIVTQAIAKGIVSAFVELEAVERGYEKFKEYGGMFDERSQFYEAADTAFRVRIGRLEKHIRDLYS